MRRPSWMGPLNLGPALGCSLVSLVVNPALRKWDDYQHILVSVKCDWFWTLEHIRQYKTPLTTVGGNKNVTAVSGRAGTLTYFVATLSSVNNSDEATRPRIIDVIEGSHFNQLLQTSHEDTSLIPVKWQKTVFTK